jgi:hypothetical protein
MVLEISHFISFFERIFQIWRMKREKQIFSLFIYQNQLLDFFEYHLKKNSQTTLFDILSENMREMDLKQNRCIESVGIIMFSHSLKFEMNWML